MPHSAHVLVAAADDVDRGRLAVLLADSGYRVSAAASGQKALGLVRELKPDVVMLGSSLQDVELGRMTEELRTADTDAGPDAGPRVVVVAPAIADTLRGRCIVAGADDVIEGPIDPTVILARMKPLCRMATMQAELRRRAATTRALGAAIADGPAIMPGSDPSRVMVVADPGGTTERAVRAALSTGFSLFTEADPYRAGAAVVAERFDAMVLAADGARDAAEPVLYLASNLRNNPGLFNLPVMMLHAQDMFADRGEPYRFGASMAMTLPIERQALASGLQVLVRRQRARWAMRDAFRGLFRALYPDAGDAVYPEAFLHAHLDRMLKDAHGEGRHLSVALFSLHNLAEIKRKYFAEAGDLLVGKVATWVHGLVRAEDLVARLGDGALCVVLPDTAQEECIQAVHRIVAILSASDFHLTEEVMRPVRVWVDGGCASVVPGDTPQALLDRARASLF